MSANLVARSGVFTPFHKALGGAAMLTRFAFFQTGIASAYDHAPNKQS